MISLLMSGNSLEIVTCSPGRLFILQPHRGAAFAGVSVVSICISPVADSAEHVLTDLFSTWISSSEKCLLFFLNLFSN